MSEDDPNLSTRRVSKDEMNQLHEMLSEAREAVDVTLELEHGLRQRVAALLPDLELEQSPEEMQFPVAVRRIFLAGLEHLENASE